MNMNTKNEEVDKPLESSSNKSDSNKLTLKMKKAQPKDSESELKSWNSQEDSNGEGESIFEDQSPVLRKISSLNKKKSADGGATNKLKMAFYTKFLEKVDIIEIVLQVFDDEDEIFDIINFLYPKLCAPIQSNLSLFKLLITQEHTELFDKLIKMCANEEYMKKEFVSILRL